MQEKFVAVIAFKEADCLYTTEASGEFFTEQEAVDLIASKQNDPYFDFGVVETRWRKKETKTYVREPLLHPHERDMEELSKAVIKDMMGKGKAF